MKKYLLKFVLTAIFVNSSILLGCGFCNQQDYQYKVTLVKDSGNPNYKVENMKSILGEKELVKIVKKYDKHHEYFMADVYEKGDQKGVKNLTYKAGFHSHTTASDGKMTPLEALNQAAEYGDKVKAKHPFEKYPIILAYTDHYNTNGCKEAIDILQKNPKKYKNVKVLLGMETASTTHLPSDNKDGSNIHILLWAINPYAPQMTEMNFLPNYKDTVKHAQALRYGIVGIAHPLRYFTRNGRNDEQVKKLITELFDEYAVLKNDKIQFTEGYYQPYRFDVSEDLYSFTQNEARKHEIYLTGSHDSHGKSIFSNQ